MLQEVGVGDLGHRVGGGGQQVGQTSNDGVERQPGPLVLGGLLLSLLFGKGVGWGGGGEGVGEGVGEEGGMGGEGVRSHFR